MRRLALTLLAATLVLAPSIGWSAAVSLISSKDNSIFANNPDYSNGGGAGIFVGTTNGMQNNSLRRGLLEFDVADAVPADATITDVTLTMHLGQVSQASGTQTIDLHRLTADWGEETAGNFTTSISGTGTGSPASTGDATWNQRLYQETDWTAPGAVGDFVGAISASTDVGTTLDTEPYQWLSTPTLVSDVQGWLDDPSTNDGWILIDHEENVQQTVKAFYSRDATLTNTSGDPLPPSWRPTLDITYTVGSPPTGDYNGNGVVDAADYVVWRKTFNQSVSPAGSGADGNQSGTIEDGDYTYWRARFGNSASGLGSGASVPEPSTLANLLFVVGLALFRRRH